MKKYFRKNTYFRLTNRLIYGIIIRIMENAVLRTAMNRRRSGKCWLKWKWNPMKIPFPLVPILLFACPVISFRALLLFLIFHRNVLDTLFVSWISGFFIVKIHSATKFLLLKINLVILLLVAIAQSWRGYTKPKSVRALVHTKCLNSLWCGTIVMWASAFGWMPVNKVSIPN